MPGGLRADDGRGAPRLGQGRGGVSGPGLLPVGVLATSRAVESAGLPVIGIGGIRSAGDVRQYLAAGASLVAIGTAALADPRLPERIVNDLERDDGSDHSRARHGERRGSAGTARSVAGGAMGQGRLHPVHQRRPAARPGAPAPGLEVFLDLKWHDIPNTVAGSVASARELGVAMATVHTLGGIPMMRAAQEAAGGAVALVGVTVLTSHDRRLVRPGARAGWHGGVGRGTPPGGQRPGGGAGRRRLLSPRGGAGSAAPGSGRLDRRSGHSSPMRHPTISGGPPRPRRRCGTVLPIWSWGGR